jgi:hypothetical protein
VAEIQQLRTMLAAPSTANVFSLQQHAYAEQNGSSVQRPRSHYCGLHGWNNDHNGTECRVMARDRRYTDAMWAATTHVGTGGNLKVGEPVGYTRPPPHTLFPPSSSEHCLVCPPSLSQDSSAKLAHTPNEDDSARASLASPRTKSEGHNASLVRELAGAMSVLSSLPCMPVMPKPCAVSLPCLPCLFSPARQDASHPRRDSSHPLKTSLTASPQASSPTESHGLYP